jgi:hypothetical protein
MLDILIPIHSVVGTTANLSPIGAWCNIFHKPVAVIYATRCILAIQDCFGDTFGDQPILCKHR